MIKKLSVLILTVIFAFACKKDVSMKKVNKIAPPVADKKPKTLEKHGDVRVDNYYWLNERETFVESAIKSCKFQSQCTK